MKWHVEYTDEFGNWWSTLNDQEQDSIAVTVTLLERKGPFLSYPYSSSVTGSKYGQMRELRIQHKGDPYRVLYAFDPRRSAILLIGGNKAGQERWYDQFIPIADRLYAEHLESLNKEGLL